MTTTSSAQLNDITFADILASNLIRLRLRITATLRCTTHPETREQARRILAIIRYLEHGRKGFKEKLLKAQQEHSGSHTAHSPIPCDRTCESNFLMVESMLTGDHEADQDAILEFEDHPEQHGILYAPRSFYLEVLDDCWKIWRGETPGV